MFRLRDHFNYQFRTVGIPLHEIDLMAKIGLSPEGDLGQGALLSLLHEVGHLYQREEVNSEENQENYEYLSRVFYNREKPLFEERDAWKRAHAILQRLDKQGIKILKDISFEEVSKNIGPALYSYESAARRAESRKLPDDYDTQLAKQIKEGVEKIAKWLKGEDKS